MKRKKPSELKLNQAKGTVLIVDSDESVRSSISRELAAKGLDCVTAGGREAVETASTQDFDLLIMGPGRSESSEVEIIAQIVADHPEAGVVMADTGAESRVTAKTTKHSRHTYVPEEIDLDALGSRVEKALKKKRSGSGSRDSRLREVESALQKQSHDLGERVKELTCLYAISELAGKQDISLEEILRGAVQLLPPGWQYPEITTARIVVGDRAFAGDHFCETIWLQHCDVIAHGDRVGCIEVYYLEEMPAIDEGPFLKEERNLINAVAAQVGGIVERKRAEDIIRWQRDLGMSLSATADLEEGLRLCLEAALLVSGMDCGGVYLVDGESGAFDLVAHRGLSRGFVGAVSHFDGGSNNARLVAQGEPVYTSQRKMGVPVDEAEKCEGLRALAVVPVRHEGRVIGCLNVASHTVDDVAPFGRSALEAVSTQIGSAITRLATEKELSQYRLHLEELVAERAAELKDANGRLLSEIVERQQAEQVAASERDRVHKYLDVAGVMLVALDAEGRVTLMNPKGCEILGHSCSEVPGHRCDDIVGRNWFDTFLPERIRENVRGVFDQLIAGSIEPVEYFENPVLTRSGEERIIAWHNAVLTDEDGKTVGTLGSGEDITERKRAEEARLESEHRYHSLFENMLNGFAYCRIVVDDDSQPVDWVYLEVNDAFETVTGLTPEGVLGKRVTEAIPGIKEAHPELFQIYGRVALTGQEERFEIYLQPLDIWLSISVYSPVKGDFVALFENITERKKGEEELENIFSLSADMIAVCTTEGQFLRVNPPWEDVLGYTTDEILKLGWAELVHPEDKGQTDNEVVKQLHGKPVMGFVNRYRCKDGTYRTFEWRATPAEQGTVYATARDITERKSAEEALTHSEARFRSLFECMGSGVAVYEFGNNGKECIFKDLNGAAERIENVKKGDVVGRNVLDVFPGAETGFVDVFKRVWETGRPEFNTNYIYSDDGKMDTAREFYTYRLPSGEIVAVYEDITERKSAEEALKAVYEEEHQLRQQLEVEISKRVQFIRALAHELKTPLTSALAASDLLVTQLNEEPQLSLARNIYRSATNLDSRVEELLDLARGELGMLDLKLEPVDILQLLRQTADDMKPLASRQGLTLSVDLPPTLPSVDAEAGRVQQILVNLLNNAIKFSSENGRVALGASVRQDSVVVEVRDTGSGISKAEQQRLFEPYHRVEGDRDRLSGLGLGLALCKNLVELHGGRIWVESRPGEGSTFSFSLPIEVNNQMAPRSEEKADALCKVLIIEDDNEIVDVVSLAFQITWPEAQLLSACKGEKGVDMVEREDPDLVILDLGLPDIPGFEVLRRIRAFSPVPIVVLTVRTGEDDIVKALEWGADDYVAKPFRQKEFLARLQALARRRTPHGEVGPVVCGPLRLDPSTAQLTYGRREIGLTTVEGRVLHCLMRHAGDVVTHSRLGDAVWGEDYPGAIESIRVHIRRLREKLEEDPGNPKLIRTKAGVGYSLVKPT